MRQALDFLRQWALWIWMAESAFALLLTGRTLQILRIYKQTHPGERTLSPFLMALATWRAVFVVALFLLGPVSIWMQHYVPNTPLPSGLPDVVYLSGIFTLLLFVLFPAKEAWLAYKQLKFMFSGGSVRRELEK